MPQFIKFYVLQYHVAKCQVAKFNKKLKHTIFLTNVFDFCM
jgi:hypothetical protein